MYCEIVTNGMLIRKRVKEWPELRMVDSFSVSLDGNKYSHDKIRGKDNFEKVVDGIMCLVENKLPVRMHGAFSHEAFDQKAKPHQFMANLSNEFNIPFNVATYCSNPMKTNEDEENKVLEMDKIFIKICYFGKKWCSSINYIGSIRKRYQMVR